MSTTEQTAETEAQTATGLASETPPVGEEIHLPGQSAIPLVVAIGITLTVIGTTIDWIWSVLGLIIFIVAVGIWIRDTRRDIAELPEEHHH
jgi:type IV secretory pathway TrbD component